MLLRGGPASDHLLWGGIQHLSDTQRNDCFEFIPLSPSTSQPVYHPSNQYQQQPEETVEGREKKTSVQIGRSISMAQKSHGSNLKTSQNTNLSQAHFCSFLVFIPAVSQTLALTILRIFPASKICPHLICSRDWLQLLSHFYYLHLFANCLSR